MRTYLISYDLAKPHLLKHVVAQAIMAAGQSWARPLEQTWYVRTEESEEALEAKLTRILDSDDGLLIQRVKEDAVLTNTSVRWFKQRQGGVETRRRYQHHRVPDGAMPGRPTSRSCRSRKPAEAHKSLAKRARRVFPPSPPRPVSAPEGGFRASLFSCSTGSRAPPAQKMSGSPSAVRRSGGAGRLTRPRFPTGREISMRFMIMVKATADSEAGVLPTEGLACPMADYHEELCQGGRARRRQRAQADVQGLSAEVCGRQADRDRRSLHGDQGNHRRLHACIKVKSRSRKRSTGSSCFPKSASRRLRNRDAAAVRAGGLRTARVDGPVPGAGHQRRGEEGLGGPTGWRPARPSDPVILGLVPGSSTGHAWRHRFPERPGSSGACGAWSHDSA